jgi:hypothetical protein
VQATGAQIQAAVTVGNSTAETIASAVTTAVRTAPPELV